MSAHRHPHGTPDPAGRADFLVDGCPRCAEYARDLGLPFDPARFRAFWRKMVEVEFDSTGGYASDLDKQLGRSLYYVALGLQRSFGINPHTPLEIYDSLATLGLEGLWP